MLVFPAHTLGLNVCTSRTPKGTCSGQGLQRKPILSTHYLLHGEITEWPSVSYKCVYLRTLVGQGLGQGIRVPSGTSWLPSHSWALLRRITLPVSSLYKSRHARLTKCLFDDSCLHMQCLRFVFQSQKKKIPNIKSEYF